MKIKTQNGLTASIHPPNDQTARQILDVCNKTRFPPLDYLAHSVAVIELESEELALVYYISLPLNMIIETLQNDLKKNLLCVDYLVYNGEAYFARDLQGRALRTAILNKIPPSIAILLHTNT